MPLLNTVSKAYKGLVPISPYTIPSAAKESVYKVDFDCAVFTTVDLPEK